MRILTLIFILLSASGLQAKPKEAKLTKIDNGIISIGVDEERGACIGYLALSSDKINLLNHYDEGRFVQQSYYGIADGSDWNGKPWVYNPVQGGSWDLKSSKILSIRKDADNASFSSKTTPRHWATGNLCHEASMEQNIMLKGPVAILDIKFTYSGENQGRPRHQEVPAVFVDGALKTFVYHKNGTLKKERQVEVLDEGDGKTEGLSYGESSSEWFAWVNDDGHGVGIYTPGTTDFKVYRALGDGSTSPSGSSCSYVAPLRTFALTKNLVLEYTAYMTIGSIEEIQERFEALGATKK